MYRFATFPLPLASVPDLELVLAEVLDVRLDLDLGIVIPIVQGLFFQLDDQFRLARSISVLVHISLKEKRSHYLKATENKIYSFRDYLTHLAPGSVFVLTDEFTILGEIPGIERDSGVVEAEARTQ